MAGIKIVDLPPLGRDLASTDLLELSLAGGTGSRKITGQEIMNTSKLNIGTTAITSGTVGRVLFEGTGNVVQESANLFWDNTNERLGIGTSTPATSIDTTGIIRVGGTFVYGDTNNQYLRLSNVQGTFLGYNTSNITIVASSVRLIANGLEVLRASQTGNVLIGTTTDAGFKLDVNGTARVSGTFTSTSSVNGGFSALFQNTSTGIQGSVGVNVANNSATIGGISTYSSTNNTGYLRSNIVLASYPTASDLILGTSFDVSGSGTGRILFKLGGYGGAPTSAIFSTGNWGINTTTDAGYKLDVNGTSNFRDVARFDSAGNNKRVLISSNASNSYISMFGDVGGYITSSSDIRLSPTTGNIWINEAWYIGSFPSIDTYGAVGIRGQNAKAMYFENNSNDQYVSGFVFNYSGSGGFNSGSGLFKVLWNNQSRLQMNTNGNVLINTTTDAGFRLDVNGTARVDQTLRLNGTGTGEAIRYGSSGRVTIDGSFIRHKSSSAQDMININDNFVGINATSVIASAMMAINSTNRGFLPPRMTQAQRNAIASPAIGLEIYQTDATEGKYIYKSSGWTYIG